MVAIIENRTTLYTLSERPELRGQISDIHLAVWPAFMGESEVANHAWEHLFNEWAEFQVALVGEDGKVLAAGHTLPVCWDGRLSTLPEGWEAATQMGLDDLHAGTIPNALQAYAIVVAPGEQGRGHSSVILEAMRLNARRHNMHAIMAAVRPTLKASHPLVPMEDYVRWTRPDGQPFDPWIRVHARAGAELVRVSPHSMVITGTVTQWESWAKMSFPESGEYVVQGALEPVSIDREADLGRYNDPNVWMVHRV